MLRQRPPQRLDRLQQPPRHIPRLQIPSQLLRHPFPKLLPAAAMNPLIPHHRKFMRLRREINQHRRTVLVMIMRQPQLRESPVRLPQRVLNWPMRHIDINLPRRMPLDLRQRRREPMLVDIVLENRVRPWRLPASARASAAAIPAAARNPSNPPPPPPRCSSLHPPPIKPSPIAAPPPEPYRYPRRFRKKELRITMMMITQRMIPNVSVWGILTLLPHGLPGALVLPLGRRDHRIDRRIQSAREIALLEARRHFITLCRICWQVMSVSAPSRPYPVWMRIL